jgi:hypothetical protein
MSKGAVLHARDEEEAGYLITAACLSGSEASPSSRAPCKGAVLDELSELDKVLGWPGRLRRETASFPWHFHVR